MEEVCVVIPCYKKTLSLNEEKAILRCLKIFSNYKIVFVSPRDLVLNNNFKSIKSYYFDKFYFNDIPGYNKLMLSKEFYLKFNDFKYILIFQLDAWVFRDELSDWCNKGYDYIGSPWVDATNDRIKLKTGNGGFSLRNVQAHIDTLNTFRIMQSRKDIIQKELFKSANNWLKLFGVKNNSKYFIDNFSENEDYFWSHFAPQINSKFRVSSPKDALKFSFEKEPSLLFKINNNVLPFGCHAWEKYEPEFWKKHINHD